MKLFDWMLSGFLLFVLLALVFGIENTPEKPMNRKIETVGSPQDPKGITSPSPSLALEDPIALDQLSEVIPAPDNNKNLANEISLSISHASSMEQALLAIADIISTSISERPDLNFWDTDVVAFPFEEQSVKAHFFVSGRDETLAYGCEIQVPITEPFFHEGAYRLGKAMKASYSPSQQQLIVIFEEPIDFWESQSIGLSLDSKISLGMSWGRNEQGERCYFSYWENKSIHTDFESPCYAGIVNSETVNRVISRLSQLERKVRND